MPMIGSRRARTSTFCTAVIACGLLGCVSVRAQESLSLLIVDDQADLEEGMASPAMPLLGLEYSRRHINLGIELGPYSFRTDRFREWIDDGFYFGLRQSMDLGPNAAMSFSAGYFSAETVVIGGETLQFFPLRGQLEIGSLLGTSMSRWYVSGGVGYNVTEERPSEDQIDLWPDLPYLSNEFISSVALGFEYRNESLISSRLEVGHLWLHESMADLWASTFTVSYQF